MKEAIYHISRDKSGFTFEITGTRDGYNTKMQNRKLFCRKFHTVDSAKAEMTALKADGYTLKRGDDL